jgi:hypothetical protein
VAGTLQVADDGFNTIVNQGNAVVTVDAGATLDLGGFSLATPLFGGGAVTNSGAATTLILAGAKFFGSDQRPGVACRRRHRRPQRRRYLHRDHYDQ